MKRLIPSVLSIAVLGLGAWNSSLHAADEIHVAHILCPSRAAATKVYEEIATKGGDDKARAWLAKYCLGKSPPSLMELKVKDESGLTATEEVRQELDKSKNIETRMHEYCDLIGIEHDRST